MRRIYSGFALIISSIMLLVSCTDSLLYEENQYMKYKCEYEDDGDVATKTVMSSKGSIVWQAEDMLSVFQLGGPSSGSEFTVSSISADGTSAEIMGVLEGDCQDLYASYPFGGRMSTNGQNVSFSLSIPTKQDAVANSFGKGANVSVAHLQSGKFSFLNVGGYIGVKICDSGVKSIKLTANENVSGDVTVTFDSKSKPKCDGGTSKSVSITSKSGLSKGSTYYFVVKPGTYTGVTLQYTNNDGSTFKAYAKQNLVVSRNSRTLISETAVPDYYKNVKIIAHRGYHSDGSTAPENSIAALQAAQSLGVWGVETDIRATTDKVFVISHDENTPAGNKITTSTYAQIKDDKLSNGESIPTFDAFLKEAKKTPDLILFVEIKSIQGSSSSDRNAMMKVATDLVDKYGMADQVVWGSFWWEYLTRIQTAKSNAKLFYLRNDGSVLESSTSVDAMKAKKVIPSYNITPNSNLSYISVFHNAGLEYNAWTINSEEDFKLCILNGVDIITTDKPATIARYLGR